MSQLTAPSSPPVTQRLSPSSPNGPGNPWLMTPQMPVTLIAPGTPAPSLGSPAPVILFTPQLPMTPSRPAATYTSGMSLNPRLAAQLPPRDVRQPGALPQQLPSPAPASPPVTQTPTTLASNGMASPRYGWPAQVPSRELTEPSGMQQSPGLNQNPTMPSAVAPVIVVANDAALSPTWNAPTAPLSLSMYSGFGMSTFPSMISGSQPNGFLSPTQSFPLPIPPMQSAPAVLTPPASMMSFGMSPPSFPVPQPPPLTMSPQPQSTALIVVSSATGQTFTNVPATPAPRAMPQPSPDAHLWASSPAWSSRIPEPSPLLATPVTLMSSPSASLTSAPLAAWIPGARSPVPQAAAEYQTSSPPFSPSASFNAPPPPSMPVSLQSPASLPPIVTAMETPFPNPSATWTSPPPKIVTPPVLDNVTLDPPPKFLMAPEVIAGQRRDFNGPVSPEITKPDDPETTSGVCNFNFLPPTDDDVAETGSKSIPQGSRSVESTKATSVPRTSSEPKIPAEPETPVESKTSVEPKTAEEPERPADREDSVVASDSWVKVYAPEVPEDIAAFVRQLAATPEALAAAEAVGARKASQSSEVSADLSRKSTEKSLQSQDDPSAVAKIATQPGEAVTSTTSAPQPPPGTSASQGLPATGLGTPRDTEVQTSAHVEGAAAAPQSPAPDATPGSPAPHAQLDPSTPVAAGQKSHGTPSKKKSKKSPKRSKSAGTPGKPPKSPSKKKSHRRGKSSSPGKKKSSGRKSAVPKMNPQLGLAVLVQLKPIPKNGQMVQDHCVCILAVAPNGPCYRAGLHEGDIIVAWGGQKLTSQAQWNEKVATLQPGTMVKFTVYSNGATRDVLVTADTVVEVAAPPAARVAKRKPQRSVKRAASPPTDDEGLLGW